MKAVIYARYSSDNQREESIEGQLRECTAYCKKNDISIEEAGTVCNRFFDYDDGDFAMSISDSMAMDSDGNLMMRMGDHMAMDMDTGDIHMISSWSDDDEE